MDVVLPTIPEDFQPPSSSPNDVIDDDCDFDGDNDEGMMSLLRQNPADVAQRLIAMIEVESRPHYRSRDHLRSSHNEGCRSVVGTTVETRAKVVHWLYECVDYLGLNRELVESAMSNVDRLLSDRRRRRRRECEYGDVYDVEDDDLADNALRDGSSYQLVALSSLFLVAKVAGSSSASPEWRRRRGGGRTSGGDNGVVADVRDYAALSHGAHSAAEIVSAERTILEGLGWRMSRPTSASIARHAMALFLNAAGTTTSRRNGAPSSSRSSGTSDLLRSIERRIEASVSDYWVSISASPSAIAFASVGGILGSPLAVAAFSRAMARHGIVVVVAASASSSTSATAGHRDGGDSMHRGGGRDPEEEGGVQEGPSSFHSSTDALCESPQTRGVEESSEEANAMEEEKERSIREGSDRHRGRRRLRRSRSRRSLASSTVSSDGSPAGVDEMITVDPRRGGRREQRTSSSDARRHDTTPRRSCGVAKMTMKSSTRIEICCGGVTDDRNNGKRSTDTRGRRVPLEP